MKILIVEDVAEKERRIVETIMGVHGMKPGDVLVARSIISAKRALTESRFDVLILDIQIPQRDGEKVRRKGGVELLESLMTSKRLACPPHVIGLTAYNSSEEIDAAFSRSTSVILKYDPRDSNWEGRLQLKVDHILTHELAGQPVSATSHYVVLVHGIRTHANWAEMVAGLLSKNGLIPVPLRYGYLDALRFLCPFFARRAPIKKVLRELRDLRAECPTADISVICHSFGTYSITRCLLEPDVRLKRIIFCGSIVPTGFRRATFKAQLGADPILNDCGTKDWWPIIAKSFTWGFGPSGTFGFGTLGIRDRFNEYGHSDYFNEQFVEDYWLPYLVNGEIVPTAWESVRRTPSWWMSMPIWLQVKYLLIVLFIAFLTWNLKIWPLF